MHHVTEVKMVSVSGALVEPQSLSTVNAVLNAMFSLMFAWKILGKIDGLLD
jgi:hypothetical protein